MSSIDNGKRTPSGIPFSGTYEGRLLTIASKNAESIADIFADNFSQEFIALGAELHIPEKGGRQKPAMVLLHASEESAGKSLRAARALHEIGVVTLRLDSFTARQRHARQGQKGAAPPNDAMILIDALRGLAFLARHPDVNPERIGVMGWSEKGGGAVFFAAIEKLRRILLHDIEGDVHFAAHIAFYPPCFIHIQNHQLTGAPFQILVGEKDEWTTAPACDLFTKSLQEKGVFVDLLIYPKAQYGFDGDSTPVKNPEIFNHGACLFEITEEGQMQDQKTGRILKNAQEKNDALAECAGEKAATVASPKIALRGLNDVQSFLTKNLIDR